MDPDTATRLLTELAEPSTTLAEAERIMARFDGHEIEAALPVFRRLHDAAEQAEIHAAARLLGRWRGRPVARALVPALGTLLSEPGVGDLNKLAAAGVLETLGEPVDYPVLLAGLGDLGAVARASLDAALAAAVHPAALVNFVDQLGRMPAGQVLALVDGIPGDQAEAAAPILAALTYSADPDLAVSAIAAIDRLRLRAVAGPLARVAEAQAEPIVREQARLTLARLGGRPEARERAAPAGARAYQSAPRADGGQLLLLAIPSHAAPAWFDILTVYANTADGVREYGTVEAVAPDRFRLLREECDEGGVPLARAGWRVVVEALDAAIMRSLRGGGMREVGPVAWLATLDLSEAPKSAAGRDLD